MLDQALSIPSPWVAKWSSLFAPNSRVLDLACGTGRHARFLAQLGHRVVAVDRDIGALSAWADAARPRVSIDVQRHDLEAQAWPYADAVFDAIVVTNYLHRPLFDSLLAALAPNGMLLYETFARGNERFGKPSNPDFLLEPGELLQRVLGVLRVVAYQDCFVDQPKPALVQRVCAIKAASVPLVSLGL